jgi:uncharacterized Zn-binding protein involved in type VI secretion
MPASLWERATNYRYLEVAELYMRQGERVSLGRLRTGPVTAVAVAARAAAHSQDMPESAEAPAEPAPPEPKGVLATVAAGIETAIGWEQKLSAPLGRIPFPGFPALRILDMGIGLPHAHNHPPNITPPNPIPVPLPSTGPVIPIPILSGALVTHMNGQPAARCGDMGVGAWCGGFFPMYEVCMGSATVWIEGARAGRMGVDITKHCTFSTPRPTDPPLGPMIGTTVNGSPSVWIGGIPMPSLFSLAIGVGIKGLFRGANKVIRRATADKYIDNLLKKQILELHGPPKWKADMLVDLKKVARSPTGRSILRDIEKSGNKVLFGEYPHLGVLNSSAQELTSDGLMDLAGKPGKGSHAVVRHTPSSWANHGNPKAIASKPGTTSDAILNHELNHARNATVGRMSPIDPSTAPTRSGWDTRWKEFEEYSTTHADNAYRRENGLPLRVNYGHLP